MRTSSTEHENRSRQHIFLLIFWLICVWLSPFYFSHNTSHHHTGSGSNLGWNGPLEVISFNPLLKGGQLYQVSQGSFLSILCFFPFSPLIQPHPPSSCLQFPTALLLTTGEPEQYVRMSRAVYGQKENEDVVEQIRFSRRWWRRRRGGRCWGDQGYAKDWGSGFVVGRNAVSVLQGLPLSACFNSSAAELQCSSYEPFDHWRLCVECSDNSALCKVKNVWMLSWAFAYTNQFGFLLDLTN